MSNLTKNRTSPEQLSLLDISEGWLADFPFRLRSELVKAIKHCSLSRYQIAARISELMEREISKEMLDKYCSESAEGHRVPAELIPAIVLVTGYHPLLKIFAEPVKCLFVDPEESEALAIVRLRLEKEKLQKQIKALEKKTR